MTTLRILAALFVVFIYLGLSPSAQAQSDYTISASLARSQGKVHLIYFYNPEWNHPEKLNELLGDIPIPENYIVTNLDLSSEMGTALAEAFYGRSQVKKEDWGNAAIVTEYRIHWRGLSFLGKDLDKIDPSTWHEFFANAGKGEYTDR